MKSIDFTTPGMITSLRIGCYQIESPVNNIWKATFRANTNNASTDLNDEFHRNKSAFHFFLSYVGESDVSFRRPSKW